MNTNNYFKSIHYFYVIIFLYDSFVLSQGKIQDDLWVLRRWFGPDEPVMEEDTETEYVTLPDKDKETRKTVTEKLRKNKNRQKSLSSRYLETKSVKLEVTTNNIILSYDPQGTPPPKSIYRFEPLVDTSLINNVTSKSTKIKLELSCLSNESILKDRDKKGRHGSDSDVKSFIDEQVNIQIENSLVEEQLIKPTNTTKTIYAIEYYDSFTKTKEINGSKTLHNMLDKYYNVPFDIDITNKEEYVTTSVTKRTSETLSKINPKVRHRPPHVLLSLEFPIEVYNNKKLNDGMETIQQYQIRKKETERSGFESLPILLMRTKRQGQKLKEINKDYVYNGLEKQIEVIETISLTESLKHDEEISTKKPNDQDLMKEKQNLFLIPTLEDYWNEFVRTSLEITPKTVTLDENIIVPTRTSIFMILDDQLTSSNKQNLQETSDSTSSVVSITTMQKLIQRAEENYYELPPAFKNTKSPEDWNKLQGGGDSTVKDKFLVDVIPKITAPKLVNLSNVTANHKELPPAFKNSKPQEDWNEFNPIKLKQNTMPKITTSKLLSLGNITPTRTPVFSTLKGNYINVIIPNEVKQMTEEYQHTKDKIIDDFKNNSKENSNLTLLASKLKQNSKLQDEGDSTGKAQFLNLSNVTANYYELPPPFKNLKPQEDWNEFKPIKLKQNTMPKITTSKLLSLGNITPTRTPIFSTLKGNYIQVIIPNEANQMTEEYQYNKDKIIEEFTKNSKENSNFTLMPTLKDHWKEFIQKSPKKTEKTLTVNQNIVKPTRTSVMTITEDYRLKYAAEKTNSISPVTINEKIPDLVESNNELSPLFMNIKPQEYYWNEFRSFKKDRPMLKFSQDDTKEQISRTNGNQKSLSTDLKSNVTLTFAAKAWPPVRNRRPTKKKGQFFPRMKPYRTSTIFHWTYNEDDVYWPNIKLIIKSEFTTTKSNKLHKTFRTYFPAVIVRDSIETEEEQSVTNYTMLKKFNNALRGQWWPWAWGWPKIWNWWRQVKGKTKFSAKRRRRTKKKVSNRKHFSANAIVCYECGLNFDIPDMIPNDTSCYDAFHHSEAQHIALRINFQQVCGPRAYRNGCFIRYLDLGTIYNERGCRSEDPEFFGSYASQRLASLEFMLNDKDDGCIHSPAACLTPFSRTVSVWVYYHVCVCVGQLCNHSSMLLNNIFLVALSLVVSIYV